MTVVFCGHSDYVQSRNDQEQILNILETAVGDVPCEIFLGGYGNFDSFALRCAKEFRKSHPNTKLRLISPYLRNGKASYEAEAFDSVIYPSLEHVPPRYAISHRNRWMAETADIVIAYISHQYGGAYTMYLHAKRKGKKIYNLSSLK